MMQTSAPHLRAPRTLITRPCGELSGRAAGSFSSAQRSSRERASAASERQPLQGGTLTIATLLRCMGSEIEANGTRPDFHTCGAPPAALTLAGQHAYNRHPVTEIFISQDTILLSI